MSSSKSFSDVKYDGKTGVLRVHPTAVIHQADDEHVVEWPYASIKRQMIKSVNQDKHLIRLILVEDGAAVLLEVTSREMLEQINQEVSQARKRNAVSASPPPSSNPKRSPKKTMSLPMEDQEDVVLPLATPTANLRRAQSAPIGAASKKLPPRTFTPPYSHQSNNLQEAPTPGHWTQTNDDKLVEISPREKEYWRVLKKLRETMPEECHLSHLYRIQNEGLWNYYSFRKHKLAKKYQGHNLPNAINEQSVWHGTSSLNPEVIYQDEHDGFMMQYSQVGQWGRGIYFSERSGYSDHYAYKPNDSNRELILAKLLVGQAVLLDRREGDWKAQACRELVAPPDNPTLAGCKYDTVTGIVQDQAETKVHVVYENGRAYPEYLVRYYKGKRDRAQTPFGSWKAAHRGVDDDNPKEPQRKTKPAPPRRNGNAPPEKASASSPSQTAKATKRQPAQANGRSPSTSNRSPTKEGKRLPEEANSEQPQRPRRQKDNSAPRGRQGKRLPDDSDKEQAQGPQRNNSKQKGEAKEEQSATDSLSSEDASGGTASRNRGPGALAVQGMNADNTMSNQTITVGDRHSDRVLDIARKSLADGALIEARIVEDDDEVVQAEPMPAARWLDVWKNPKSRMVFLIVALVVLVLIVAVILALTLPIDDDDNNMNSHSENSNSDAVDGGASGGASNTLLNLFAAGRVLRSTINALDNPDSPQSKAQEWLLADPNFADYNPNRRAQRFILATFFYATLGEEWAVSDGWLDYSIHECQWFFSQATCNDGSLETIRMTHNNLLGTLVPELGVLPDLKKLSFAESGLRGQIPFSIFMNPNLTEFALKRTRIRGSIPTEIQQATSLLDLELVRNNAMEGKLPSEVGQLSKLSSLRLSRIGLGGTLPSELGLLTRLEVLNLSSDEALGLEGTVPSELSSLTDLQVLDLSNNEALDGTLSPELARMTNLQQVDLSSTDLSGEIPWCLDQISIEMTETSLEQGPSCI